MKALCPMIAARSEWARLPPGDRYRYRYRPRKLDTIEEASWERVRLPKELSNARAIDGSRSFSIDPDASEYRNAEVVYMRTVLYFLVLTDPLAGEERSQEKPNELTPELNELPAFIKLPTRHTELIATRHRVTSLLAVNF